MFNFNGYFYVSWTVDEPVSLCTILLLLYMVNLAGISLSLSLSLSLSVSVCVLCLCVSEISATVLAVQPVLLDLSNWSYVCTYGYHI